MRWLHWLAPLTIASVLVACGVAVGWWIYSPSPQAPATVAKPAPQVAKVPTETVKTAPVKTFTAPAKKRLGLPASVQADSHKHVAAAARVEPDIRPHTISTVLDSETGEFVTYDRAEPLPWLQAAKRGEVGVGYGWKGGRPVTRLYVNQGLLDIKAMRLGVLGALDSDGEASLMVALAYRW